MWQAAHTHLHEVVDQPVVEVLTTQVCVTSCGLDLKDTIINAEQGHIEGATAQVKDEHIALTNGPLGLSKHKQQHSHCQRAAGSDTATLHPPADICQCLASYLANSLRL
jgi:hypothetical protein